MIRRWPINCPWCVNGFLLRKLCSRHYGVTIKDMVHELSVSEKTIRRDLETFQNGRVSPCKKPWASLAARPGTWRTAKPSRA